MSSKKVILKIILRKKKKLFLLLKDSICEFILLSQVILLSRHSFIYIKIVQFRILQGNLSESSPVGWSVVCCNQTKVVQSHAYNRRIVKPPFFVKIFETRNSLRRLIFISSKYFRHSSLFMFKASSRLNCQRSSQDILELRKKSPKVYIKMS